MYNTESQIRADQAAEAKRRTLSPNRPVKKQFVAKGHDAILKSIQDANGWVAIQTLHGDGPTRGRLVARDKYTITIETAALERVTIYKHAIESFRPIVQVQ